MTTVAKQRNPELDFFAVLTLASHRGYLLVKQAFEEAGVEPGFWALLPHIAAHGSATPTQLAAETAVTPTTIRDQLQSLVERKLIVRRPNPDDARSYFVELTAAGRKALELGRAATARALAALEDELGDTAELRERLLDMREAAARVDLQESA